MDCTSESASHYAGCECNEEHWREQLAAAVAARGEAEADIARLERLHAACDATIRELTSKALAAVRGQEAAEARAAEAERRVAELEARGHDGQPCTTERPCCVCEGRIAAEARAERLAGAAKEVVRGEWWGHYCPCCHATAGHGPGCLIGKLAAALAEEVRR